MSTAINTIDHTELSRRARLRLLRMHYDAGVGHIGGNLSALDANADYLVRVTAPNRIPTQYNLSFDLADGADPAENEVDMARKADVVRRDVIVGGDGNDVISTGDGNARLIGGDGNDDLSAGAGHEALPRSCSWRSWFASRPGSTTSRPSTP